MSTLIRMSDGEPIDIDKSRAELVREISDALNVQTSQMGDPERTIPKGFLNVRNKNGDEIVVNATQIVSVQEEPQSRAVAFGSVPRTA